MQILNAPEGEKLLTLAPPGGPVGRSPESALVLAYDSVSRQHAELRYDGKDWWLYHRSQTSATLLDEQLVAASEPRKLGQRGKLQFGRVMVEYRQEALPPARPPAEPSSGEVTLVLPRRASVVFPQALLAQMSPVRADAPESPEPASPPPTLTRMPRLPPSPPQAGATQQQQQLRATPPPPPAAPEAPPTMLRVNRPPIPAADANPPPTLIRRNNPPPIPPSPAASPAAPVHPAATGPMSATQPLTSAAVPLPVVEHRHDLQPQVAPTASAGLTQLQAERDRLRDELDRATAEVAKLRRNEGVLQDAKAALSAQLAALHAEKPPASAVSAPNPDVTALREKALELLQPFSRSLEQVSEALRKGSPEEARTLLRSASFALADLRDLFQS